MTTPQGSDFQANADSSQNSEAPGGPPNCGRRERGVFAPKPADQLAEDAHEARREYASALRAELRAIAQRRLAAKRLRETSAHSMDSNESSQPESRSDGDARQLPVEAASDLRSPSAADATTWWRRLRSALSRLRFSRTHNQDSATSGPCGDRDVVSVPDEDAARISLVGLSLSGGGIRSATFALGALQALGENDVLADFDYCSTVSGGGFVGGWWSAWLSRPKRTVADGIFPADERLEPDRFPATLLDPDHLPAGSDRIPEGSRSVVELDPIHHVRLFSNYLTPRRGALSADTWRAATIVLRNMVLTWLVMLPLLLALMLLGQLYFAGRRDVGFEFACSVPDRVVTTRVGNSDSIVSTTPRLAASPLCAALSPLAPATRSHAAVLKDRFDVVIPPITAFVIAVVILTLLWMLYSSGRVRLTIIGLGGLALLLKVLFTGAGVAGQSGFGDHWMSFAGSRWGDVTLYAAIAIVALLGVWPVFVAGWRSLLHMIEQPESVHAINVPRDLVRNTIVRWQAKTNIAFFIVVAGVLLLGFGHEIIWYLFYPSTGRVADAARQAGGYLALLIAAGSAIITFINSFPSPKGQDATAKKPNLIVRVATAVAPVLTVVALSIACAGLAHWILRTRTQWTDGLYPESNAASLALLAAIGIIGLFGLAESLHFADKISSLVGMGRRMTVALSVLGPAGLVLYFIGRGRIPNGATMEAPAGVYTLLSLSVAVLALRVANSRTTIRGRRATIALGLGVAAAVQWWLMPFLVGRTDAGGSPLLYRTAFFSLLFFAGYLLVDWIIRERISQRVTALMGIAIAAAFALTLLHHLPHELASTALATTSVGWAGFLVAWVVGLGWMVDPNLVALHNFYKSRLVRAYLGASNAEYRVKRDITEAAPNDDVLLKDLANHCHGAPLQLINTTLNLVGGRDLATAQRSAALFTMSSQVCGSARTGYRATSEYMSGTLSLGTAVAASGAAVSPTMGTKGVSSALSLLLALFNIRLGFWAPTPNKSRWQEAQPRMWPYYLLTEALSQTNDLGTYCYLTDGGHFDNTGIYSLVERGCQTIVALDDGADPNPCFSDMGDAVRRCRIDFGAEIRFRDGVKRFIKAASGGLTKVHYALGTIEYRPAHLRMLGWSEADIAKSTTGQIIWIKPVVTARDSVDVRQYRLENGNFPQQTTADQWYDEAQFESYRALGYQSVKFRIEELRRPGAPNDRVTALMLASLAPTGGALSKRPTSSPDNSQAGGIEGER